MLLSRTNRKSKKLVADINIVPYIDVMLVLLVIFMVTAPLLQQGVQVELPKAHAKALDKQDKEPLIVSVDKEGNYFLNTHANPNKVIDPEALLVRVRAEILRDPKRSVLVKGDKAVDYGKVVEAMVLLQKAGVPGVGLLTDNFSETG